MLMMNDATVHSATTKFTTPRPNLMHSARVLNHADRRRPQRRACAHLCVNRRLDMQPTSLTQLGSFARQLREQSSQCAAAGSLGLWRTVCAKRCCRCQQADAKICASAHLDAMEWGGWMMLRMKLSALHESCSEFCNTSHAKQSIYKTIFCGTISPQAVISHASSWLPAVAQLQSRTHTSEP